LTGIQSFTITVTKRKKFDKVEMPEPTDTSARFSGGGGRAGGFVILKKAETLVIKKDNVPISELRIQFKNPVIQPIVEVERLLEKPPNVRSISKRVYQYIQIDNLNFEDKDIEEASINFVVERSWLKENSISPENVALHRYVGFEWEQLPINISSKEGEVVRYEAITKGFSLFAISVKEESNIAIINNELKAVETAKAIREAYSISGFVLKSDRKTQVKKGTVFVLQNLNNNDIVRGVTGIGPATGAFFAIITANYGDKLLVRIDAEKHAEGTFALKGDMEGVIFVMQDTGELTVLETSLSNTLTDQITGLTTAAKSSKKTRVIAFLLAAILIGILVKSMINKNPLLRKKKSRKKRKLK
jgi:PGF-pre-PGF domain-containing protein